MYFLCFSCKVHTLAYHRFNSEISLDLGQSCFSIFSKHFTWFWANKGVDLPISFIHTLTKYMPHPECVCQMTRNLFFFSFIICKIDQFNINDCV